MNKMSLLLQFLFGRLQSSAQVSVGKIQQQGADWNHGAFRSREIHPDEYSCRIQVKCCNFCLLL